MQLAKIHPAAGVLLVCAFCTAYANPLPEFTDIVERASPAVVNISTSQRVQAPAPRARPPADGERESPFNELFRRFFGEDGGRGFGFEFEEFDSASLGSGFIISADGYVLTNYHVVRGADEIVVTLSDRRQLLAEVVGHDENSDLALIRIDADDLPVVDFGSSDGLRVGEWVLAIGSPFGFEHSVTAGIVSAKGRALSSERYVPFIQTDVAINPGNSGGPLFNLDGEVIGINSQIYSRTGGFMGVSFAIPIEVALDVVGQLRESGRVSRGWMGVNIQDVTRELAQSFDLPRPEGALVSRIMPGSPAAKSGLEVGDVIMEFNGNAVERSANLPQLVGRLRAGQQAEMVVLRGGEARTLSIVLEELPLPQRVVRAPTAPPRFDGGRLGVVVEDLSREQRDLHDISDFGVLVTGIGEGPAYRGGVREGDIILMLDKVRVRDSAHFSELGDKLDLSQPVPVLVQRRGAPVFLAVQAGNAE